MNSNDLLNGIDYFDDEVFTKPRLTRPPLDVVDTDVFPYSLEVPSSKTRPSRVFQQTNFLNDEIHKWLQEETIGKWLFVDRLQGNTQYLYFENDVDAIHFKLRWL